MSKIIAVQPFDEEFALTFDNPVEGLIVTERNAMGDILSTEKGEKDTISINAKYLCMMLYQQHEDIALIRAARGTPLEARHVVAILLNATCDVEPTFHEAGSVEDGYTHLNDRYSYELTNIKLSERAETMVSKAIEQIYNVDDLLKG